MLNAGYSWRLYFYVCVAFAGALLIAAFIFVEESTYKRNIIIQTPEGEYVKNTVEEEEIQAGLPMRNSWRQQLSLMPVVNHDVSYWKTTFRPFTYLVVPAVFWVIATYGIVCSLSIL